MELVNAPLGTIPVGNPAGCPRPMAANAVLRRRRPGGEAVDDEAGNGGEAQKPRKMMSCVPFCEKPQARVETPCRKQPIRYMMRLPTMVNKVVEEDDIMYVIMRSLNISVADYQGLTE